MRRIGLRLVLALSLTLAPLAVEGQQPGKVWRIGYLSPGDPSQTKTLLEAFRRRLRELGYVEGRNLTIGGMHAHARPRAPGTAHLRCGLGDSGWTTA